VSKNLIFYLFALLLFISLIAFVINKGEKTYSLKENVANKTTTISLHKSILPTDSNENKTSTGSQKRDFTSHLIGNPLSILILQIIIVIVLARLLGIFFAKIGQPSVIGEIIAGIILGPSLFGHIFPDVFNFVFSADSLKYLEILSQIGLILFMFIIGMELDVKTLRVRVKSALIISHTSILISFLGGVLIAYFLYDLFAPPNRNFTDFALFIGISMSIAAFPVLARIIQERGMTKTTFGKLILTIAAIDDLTAWCILAIVIAIIQAGSYYLAGFTILFVLLYLIIMLLLVKPLMNKIASVYISKEIFNKKIIAFVFIVLFISAFFTEIIGIKALFGGFIAGVIMPSHQHFKKVMAEKIEDFSLVVLLPLFFVFTGLRTNIGLINDTSTWSICCIIILVAIVGKFGGSFIASRFSGQSWKDSFIIGTLMNTRGLMELIVLNIGYELQILSTGIFTILVIMTLFTTFMTGPVLSMIDYFERKKSTFFRMVPDKNNLQILISFGQPKMGSSLLKIAAAFTRKDIHISALHLTPHTEITQSAALSYETNSFSQIRSLANVLKIGVKTIYKTTEDISKEIKRTSKKEKCNLLLIGAANPTINKNALGGKVKNIIEQVKCSVGVFIDKDFKELNKIIIISDYVLFEKMNSLCNILLQNSNCSITYVIPTAINNNSSYIKNDRIQYIPESLIEKNKLNEFDLLLTNINYFEQSTFANKDFFNFSPSLLLFQFKGHTF